MKLVPAALCCFIFYLLSSGSSSAQDLIVTRGGDSIRCKITGIEGIYLHYSYRANNRIINKTIKYNDIHEYKYNVYQEPDPIQTGTDHPVLRTEIKGGYTRQLYKIDYSYPDFLINYLKRLKSGYNLQAGVFYYFTSYLGAGVKYSYMRAQNSMDDIMLVNPDSTYRIGKMKDDINVHFIGPSVSFLIPSESSVKSFHIDLSAGYLGYLNQYMIIDPYKLTGHNTGFTGTVGFDIEINDRLAVAFDFSCLIGYLYQINITGSGRSETIDIDKENRENLSRFDLTIGLTFYK